MLLDLSTYQVQLRWIDAIEVPTILGWSRLPGVDASDKVGMA